jgi:hypothetical protein
MFGLVAIFITQATLMEGYVIGGVTAVLALYTIFRLERHRERHTIFGEIVAGEDVLFGIAPRDPMAGGPADVIARVDIVEGD